MIVEDIIDSGLTMKLTLEIIKSLNPKCLKVAVAFHKKMANRPNLSNYSADYTGFLMPDQFVIGYGMDYNGEFRDLRHLCRINDLGKTTFG